MRNLILLVAGAAVTITGCTATKPLPSETRRFQLEETLQICNVDALAKEKQTLLTVANDSKRSIARYQNKHGYYDEQTNTILMQKLYDYEAEVEASYRFVTQHCGAYMQCMKQSTRQPLQCSSLEQSWNKSQERFNWLAAKIREIAASVEKAHIQAHHKRKPKWGHKHRGGKPRGGCCDTINNIFTDCCG